MCWITTHPSFMREQRASIDMEVYKILSVRKDRFGRTKFVSPCMDFHYKLGKVYHAKLGITQTNYSLIIDEGLHCYSNMADDARYAGNFVAAGPYVVAPAIIPKGTRYYINEIGEIVTEKLKILL